jgi:hypothetical protein
LSPLAIIIIEICEVRLHLQPVNDGIGENPQVELARLLAAKLPAVFTD